MTTSLPSTMLTSTAWVFTVMLASSSTQTTVPWPSWRNALVGNLITAG
jgi:hypothetical protein